MSRKAKNRRRPRRITKTDLVPIYDKPELKFFDAERVNVQASVNWLVINPVGIDCLNGVVQGDGPTNRDGRVYYIHSIMLKFRVFTEVLEQQDAPSNSLHIRIALLHDTQTNQALPFPSRVWDVAGTDDWLAWRNLSYTNRFKILKDKTVIVHRFSVSEKDLNEFASAAQLIRFDWYHKFKFPLRVTCTGTGGNINVCTSNSLSIIACADEVSDHKISYQSRIRFSG